MPGRVDDPGRQEDVAAAEDRARGPTSGDAASRRRLAIRGRDRLGEEHASLLGNRLRSMSKSAW